MEIKERLIELFKGYVKDADSVSNDATFDDLGFDSLDKVDLLMKIENDFDIEFDQDIQINTVGELVNIIGVLK